MTLPHDEIRQKLVQTTLKLMDDGGLPAAKARSIAAQVGVSIGTIYNLFGSIDGLIQEANARILDGLREHALAAIAAAAAQKPQPSSTAPASGPRKVEVQLLLLAEAYVGFVEKNESRWGAMLAYNRNRTVEIVSSGYSELEETLFGWIADTLVSTRFGKEFKTRFAAARMLWSSVHGIVTMNYVGQANESSRAATWEQIELLVSGFCHGAFREPEKLQG